jgi:hypothetical protein
MKIRGEEMKRKVRDEEDKSGKKLRGVVMIGIVVSVVMTTLMPLAAAPAIVTNFTITPDTGMAGAKSEYTAVVNTTGVTSLNITIPAGFRVVAPTSAVQIAEIDVYNATGTHGYITITANTSDPQNKIDVTAGTEGIELTARGIAVNYAAGATTTIARTAFGYSAAVTLRLPTDSSNGSLNISVPAELSITNGSISIGRFVRNPVVARDYEFTADGVPETVHITAIPVPVVNTIGLLALVGIMSIVLATLVKRKRK